MTHGTLLNVWLILLVTYGQTDAICVTGRVRRGDKCCLSQFCEDTGFAECTVNNTKDTCLPCIKGFYFIGKYETSNFPDPNVCVPIKECSPEEVRNEDGECICDGARDYYRIHEGICGLVQISCTPAGRQLSQNGHCDPCPGGYFKPLTGKQRCHKKSNITCSSTEFILEGNTTTDRKCVKYVSMADMGISILGRVIIPVVVFVIVLSFIVVVIQLVHRHRRLRRRQQSQDLENHEHDEDVPLQPVNGELPIVDLENHENTVHVSLQPMDGALPIVDDDNFENEADLYQFPQDNIPNDHDNIDNSHTFEKVPYLSPQDNIPKDHDNIDNSHTFEKVPYLSSQVIIPKDHDNIDNSHTFEKVPYLSLQDSIPKVIGGPQDIDDNIDDGVEGVTRDNSQAYVNVPYPSHGSSIDNVIGGPQDIDDNIDDGVEGVIRDNSQTYVKVPYPSHGSSIDNASRGDMSSRDEDNSNQDNGSFNPLTADARSCQGAVGGDTASSISNENASQVVKLHKDQPSSEHDLQQGRMVSGPRSFPVRNPYPNLPHHLPQPHDHGGFSDEGDSGFHN